MVLDYSKLSKAAKAATSDAAYQDRLATLQADIDALAPRLRAMDRLEGAEARLKAAMESFERSRADAKRARDAFARVRQRRLDLFQPAFRHVADCIDRVYKEITGGAGTAYLSVEDAEEPYLEGLRFHAQPPGKRFLDMEQLSGGERTMAALALLMALHSLRPAPFMILDEVDAALDPLNVQRIAAYVTRQAAAGTQFVVISLKAAFYEHSDALVGIYKEGEQAGASRALTLRLSEYDRGTGMMVEAENREN